MPGWRGPPSLCVSAQKLVPSTHLLQLEEEASYSETLEQTEMNFQIAPFFSQAPSCCFLCGRGTGHLETHLHAKHEACWIEVMEGLLGCQHKGRPQMVPPAAHSAQGCPSQPLLLPGTTMTCGRGWEAPWGHSESSSNVTGQSPAWSRAALVFLSLVEWFSIKGTKGGWRHTRARL